MKLLAVLLAGLVVTAPARASAADPASEFIFFSVLEGLYEDGVSNEDVDQILMKKEGQSYFHFVYACPICGATISALQAYRGRPVAFYGQKKMGANFGSGLAAPVQKRLFSEDSHQRLVAINALVHGWIDRRMDRQRLTDAERETLGQALEAAAGICGGRLVSTLEGGYAPAGLASAARAHFSELCGRGGNGLPHPLSPP